MNYEDPTVATPRNKMSAGARIGLGCGLTVLVLMCVICGGGYWAFQWGMGELNEQAQPYEARGFQRVHKQAYTTTIPIDTETVFTLQTLVLKDGATADIAIIGQMADLHGLFEGDVDFTGQVLRIHDDAVIRGDLNIMGWGAQVVELHGVVEGAVTGKDKTQTFKAPGQDTAASDLVPPTAPTPPAASVPTVTDGS